MMINKIRQVSVIRKKWSRCPYSDCRAPKPGIRNAIERLIPQDILEVAKGNQILQCMYCGGAWYEEVFPKTYLLIGFPDNVLTGKGLWGGLSEDGTSPDTSGLPVDTGR